jgi:hypothetical protein
VKSFNICIELEENQEIFCTLFQLMFSIVRWVLIHHSWFFSKRIRNINYKSRGYLHIVRDNWKLCNYKKNEYKKYVGNLISNRHFFTDRKKVKWFQGMKKIKSIVLKSFNKSEKIGWHLLSYPKTHFQNEGLIFIQIYFCDLNFQPALVKIGSEIDSSQHILRTIYMFCFYTL